MGVSISHVKRLGTQTRDTNRNASDSFKFSKTLGNEFQRNDNATKSIPFEQKQQILDDEEEEQMEQPQKQQQTQEQQQLQKQQQQQQQPQPQQRPFLLLSDHRSSSTVSTISSKTKPCLGQSPSSEPKTFTPLRLRSRTQTFDRSRSRKIMNKCSYSRPHILRPDCTHPRPPWRPSVIKNCCNYKELEHHPPIISPTFNPNPGPRRKLKQTDCPRGCWSSLSCLSTARSVDSEAHLRRCSAARMALANKPEMTDKSSVDQMSALGSEDKTPSLVKCTSTRQSRSFQTLHNYPVFRRRRSHHLASCPSAWERRHVRHRSSPDILLDRLSAAISESSTDLESVDPFPMVQDEAFPLRYVFYVDDTPKSLRIFGYGGTASQIAREINCRVELQTHWPPTVGVFDHTRRRGDNPRPVELAFYHPGKRVRPVVVAAPSLNALLSFVKQLDHVFPEFEASRFLTDRLDKPKLGTSLESNQATLI